MQTPAVFERYQTAAGLQVHVSPVGDHGGLPIFDVELLQDGEVVDYHEDVAGWYVQALAARQGWEPA